MTTRVGMMEPPEGYVVDFDNPQRQMVWETYIILGIGMVLALLFLLQRFYVKLFILKNIGIGDGLLVVGYLISVAVQALIFYGISVPFTGVHQWEVEQPAFEQFLFLGFFVNTAIYAWQPLFCKMGILIFFLELNTASRKWRRIVFFAMFCVAGHSISIGFVSIFACKPLAASWDLVLMSDPASFVCIDRVASYKANAILGLLTDLMIVAIPIPMVAKLQITKRKKIGLMLLFILGSITVITSAVRLGLLISMLSSPDDQTWVGGPINLWVGIEANLLVMCACIPTLRSFVKTVFPTLMSSKGDSKYNTGSANPHLETIGGTGGVARPSKRSKYSRFDEEEDVTGGYKMKTLVNIQGGVNVQDDRVETGSEDDKSDKAIIQTKTTHVYYSHG